MAFLELYSDKLSQNFNFLNTQFQQANIEWAIVSKLLCGNEMYLKELVGLGIREICDSRVSNLKKIKQLAPEVQTVYIKPPSKRNIRQVVKYADVSFNTEYKTICWLSEEATRQKKLHKIIIMIELGDLREGIMGDDLINFYDSIFRLPNIKISGIGTNLNCLNGVLPSTDKLIQLSLYKQLIEARFQREIPWVTGGTSVVLPLLLKKQLPKGINHFRMGETLFFGNDLLENKTIEGMSSYTMKLFAEIIEIQEKPKVPIGVMAVNPSGEMFEVCQDDYGKTAKRAIIDIGVLDVAQPDFLLPEDKNLKIVGASSDMIVIDLENSEKEYKVGDLISFDLKYMGALRLLNSDYVEKILK
ncbi:alanine racemase [Hugenholtzia roseola]|uniref:alanine racemase n=1 Tax=Hugenholtzia roseola TaxID=1002 RepID=UPI00042439B2|nr:alanine racemase [Hugenholtzia roseola]